MHISTRTNCTSHPDAITVGWLYIHLVCGRLRVWIPGRPNLHSVANGSPPLQFLRK